MVWMKTLLLQTRANNQGNQNEGQVPDTIIVDLKIFQLLIETRKATCFKYLQVNCCKINQVNIKMPCGCLGKGIQKKV